MKPITKYIYKRTEKTKNIIVLLEDDKGDTCYHLICYYLFGKNEDKPASSCQTMKEFKNKVLYKYDILLSEASVEALSWVKENKFEYIDQIVKLKQN